MGATETGGQAKNVIFQDLTPVMRDVQGTGRRVQVIGLAQYFRDASTG